MRILIVTAHPDDAEIMAGGTIAKRVEEGDVVHLVIATSNSVDRRREALKGACCLGCQPPVFLGFTDGKVAMDRYSACLVEFTIYQIQPECVFTHCHSDPHPDHNAVSMLVAWSLLSLVAKKKLRRPLLCLMPPSLDDAQDEIMDIWVDISPTILIKLRALSYHWTQLVAIPSLWNTVLNRGRKLGAKFGVAHAEVFKLGSLELGELSSFTFPSLSSKREKTMTTKPKDSGK